ncbi:DUF3203 family protein [Pseudomonas sp. LS1212]|uniref:DUF3203 family protein n=1 Tax=Pseudomonas sp. LS1212 TaxID=2972478 RepID=UPI00215C4964|nr:DUF3203 family protein [Pseudomonas sp. LS1212]UVJ42293.1 DUF3203 family protein [Pseudomonas sp. LS1212]
MYVHTNQETRRCTFTVDDQRFDVAAADLTVTTDEALRMSVVEVNGKKVPITEDEADTLTVAGAVDGRKHLKASVPGSVI